MMFLCWPVKHRPSAINKLLCSLRPAAHVPTASIMTKQQQSVAMKKGLLMLKTNSYTYFCRKRWLSSLQNPSVVSGACEQKEILEERLLGCSSRLRAGRRSPGRSLGQLWDDAQVWVSLNLTTRNLLPLFLRPMWWPFPAVLWPFLALQLCFCRIISEHHCEALYKTHPGYCIQIPHIDFFLYFIDLGGGRLTQSNNNSNKICAISVMAVSIRDVFQNGEK